MRPCERERERGSLKINAAFRARGHLARGVRNAGRKQEDGIYCRSAWVQKYGSDFAMAFKAYLYR